jgi:hypothetical protein
MDSWNILKKTKPKIEVAIYICICMLAKRRSCVKVLSPKGKVCFRNPQVGMMALFAPMSFGPRGAPAEEQGNKLKVTPESTRKDSLLSDPCFPWCPIRPASETQAPLT